ncbi:SigE family RNA polymerase sigma factor [Kribbella sp. NPDC020789]
MADRDAAFVEFVVAAELRLQRTAYLISGDSHRADDIVQEALYKLYLVWPKVQRSGNPFAYARRIVINVAYDGARRPWRRETSTGSVPDRAGEGDFTVQDAERDEILSALRALGPSQRACVVLRYYEDLSIEQTAEILGCSQSNVKTQSVRGLAILRETLNQRRGVTREGAHHAR